MTYVSEYPEEHRKRLLWMWFTTVLFLGLCSINAYLIFTPMVHPFWGEVQVLSVGTAVLLIYVTPLTLILTVKETRNVRLAPILQWKGQVSPYDEAPLARDFLTHGGRAIARSYESLAALCRQNGLPELREYGLNLGLIEPEKYYDPLQAVDAAEKILDAIREKQDHFINQEALMNDLSALIAVLREAAAKNYSVCYALFTG